MTTPPTDDLRARLDDLIQLAYDDGDAGRELPSDETCAARDRLLAALSALPAGGGEEICRICDGGPGNNGMCLCGEQDYYVPTPPPDAAVGAQGEEEPALPWRDINECPDSDDLFWFMRGDTIDGPRSPAPDDVDYWDWFAPCEAPSSAAPAAGKGVDDGLLARAYEVVHHDADCPAIGGNGDGDCRCDAVAFLRDLEAALTRQPVAGGGMVLGANPKCHECGAALLYECAACSATNYPPAASPDYDLALHWIDRYAAGIDYPLQMDRVCEALGLSEPPEGW